MGGPSVQADQHLLVRINDTKMKAVLVIPADYPTEMLAEKCEAALGEKGIHLTPNQKKDVAKTALKYGNNPDEEIQVTFNGTPREDGEDGYLMWSEEIVEHQDRIAQMVEGRKGNVDLVEDENDDDGAQREESQATDEESDEAIDFYNQSVFICVEAGQVIAKVVKPTDGTDGIDVTGTSQRAKPGKPVNLKTDETVIVNGAGEIIAQRSGVLEHDEPHLRVLQCLTIDGNVDFSTGNIRVDADVEIVKGVRDRFVVDTPHSVCVRGLIEGAEIRTGTDLEAVSGIAGKGRGEIKVGGNLSAKYIENAKAVVEQNAEIHRSVNTCSLQVSGDLMMDSAAIIGSTVMVTGKATVSQLGTEGGEKTYIYLGASPKIQACLMGTNSAIEGLRENIQQIDERLKMLEAAGAGKIASQKEELTELTCEKSMLEMQEVRLTEKRDKLQLHFDSIRKVSLHVDRMLNPGTIIVIDEDAAHFDDAIRGPIWIGYDENKRLIMKDVRTGDSAELSKYARIRPVEPEGFDLPGPREA